MTKELLNNIIFYSMALLVIVTLIGSGIEVLKLKNKIKSLRIQCNLYHDLYHIEKLKTPDMKFSSKPPHILTNLSDLYDETSTK